MTDESESEGKTMNVTRECEASERTRWRWHIRKIGSINCHLNN